MCWTIISVLGPSLFSRGEQLQQKFDEPTSPRPKAMNSTTCLVGGEEDEDYVNDPEFPRPIPLWRTESRQSGAFGALGPSPGWQQHVNMLLSARERHSNSIEKSHDTWLENNNINKSKIVSADWKENWLFLMSETPQKSVTTVLKKYNSFQIHFDRLQFKE